MTLAQHLSAPGLALVASAAFLLVAALRPWTEGRLRRCLSWMVVLGGVPTLGWLTLLWGPGFGVAGFALGALAFCAHPRSGGHPPAMPPGAGQ
ncbi:DUF2484 family protein [Paracoccus zeaxanthinifaciens]|uniref:DUF2484 family protein n=1 Tax=Paracoccus zeaxanthinifaciens TaxID=187400 RepID=UPI0003B7AEDF|nr:DUF2484 family protein [Paracoccus zeaxanthinifaciens]